MKNSLFLRFGIVLAIYLAITFFGGEIGRKVMYPVMLLVTFLHELGHALGAVLTGGSVRSLVVNPDGSGVTETMGGMFSIILMGGYLGSAILGNLLFYIGARGQKAATVTTYILIGMMLVSALFWFNSLFSTGFLLAFAFFLYLVVSRTEFNGEVLMFLGLASIIRIIQDFNIGPSSDLEKYAEQMVFIPKDVWMYIWLIVAVVFTLINLKMVLKLSGKSNGA